MVTGCHDRVSQVDGTVTAIDDMGRRGEMGSGGLSDFTDGIDLIGVIGRENVESHNRGDAELTHNLDVFAQIGSTSEHVVRVVLQHCRGQGLSGDDFVATGVGFEGTHGGDEDGSVGAHPTDAAFDVEEPLSSHVSTESGLGEQVIAATDTDAVCDDRGVTGGDIAERAGVDEHRAVLSSL